MSDQPRGGIIRVATGNPGAPFEDVGSIGSLPCGCRPPDITLTEISLEPGGAYASTFRCDACGEVFVSRSKPMKFPTFSEADLPAEDKP